MTEHITAGMTSLTDKLSRKLHIGCKENAVKSSSFHYWLKKYSEHDEQHVTQWGEIKMTQTITVSPSKPIRLYLNDVTVDIPVDFDASSLAEVLSAIRSSC